MLTLDCSLDFDAARAESFFEALPPQPAVCLIEPRESVAEPFLIRTANLRRRMERLLGPLDPTSKRLNLRDFARGIRYRLTGSAFEQLLTHYGNARHYFPRRYRDLARLRPAAVLKVNLRNPYPRCYVTRRIPVDEAGVTASSAYYGPFASRAAADAFAERALDFFKVRRCQIKIRRDPEFPGCIYSEMKMCLAPCYAGCTAEEYASEVDRLVKFLDTGGDSLRASFEREREKASEALDFEAAASFHRRVEKLDDALRGQPELPRRIEQLDCVVLQRAGEAQTVAAFAVRGGYIADPLFLRFADMASQPPSVEQLLREHLEVPAASEAARCADLSEHLSLLARWYYSSPREGEIFFREREWPYRRILRGCSRLLAPPAAGADS